MINVLYIDDEPHNLLSFKASFRREFCVFTAESAEEGRKILEKIEIHVILSDQRMPGMSGIEFFESILETFPAPIRILITGYTDINAVIDAINRGQVYKYLTKPWNENDIVLSAVINHVFVSPVSEVVLVLNADQFDNLLSSLNVG